MERRNEFVLALLDVVIVFLFLSIISAQAKQTHNIKKEVKTIPADRDCTAFCPRGYWRMLGNFCEINGQECGGYILCVMIDGGKAPEQFPCEWMRQYAHEPQT